MNKKLIDIEAKRLNNEVFTAYPEETIPTQQITELRISPDKPASEQLIEALLTYPDRALQILEANEELINSDLVEQMELVAVEMKVKGSKDAANFLKNIATQINKALAVYKFRETNQESLVAYHSLIEVLLTYPNQTSKILAANKKLLDAGLFQAIEQMAMQMSNNGAEKAAIFLQDLANQLQEAGYGQLPPAKSKGNWKLWLGGAVILLTGISILLMNPLTNKHPPTQEGSLNAVALSSDNVLPVEIVSLEAVDSYQVSRNYTGTISANRSSELGFERNGKLLSIHVDEGQKVAKDKILADLDRSSLEVQRQELLAERLQAQAQLQEMVAGSRPETIAASRAQLEQAQAQLQEMVAGSRPETIAASRATVRELAQQLELDRSRRDRRQGLYEQGALAREEYEEVVTAVNAQQARLNQAQSQLDELLAGTRPEVIAAQRASVAQFQSQLDELLAGTRPEVIDAQKAAIAQIDARLANLQIDLDKSTLKAPFAGTIGAINLNEGTANLSLNQTVATSGYWLPNTALIKGIRGLWSCYVIKEPIAQEASKNQIFRIVRKDIEVLYTEGERVLVRGTLQNSDRVIMSGTNRLAPGQLVSVSPQISR